jgi:hypothetical protein
LEVSRDTSPDWIRADGKTELFRELQGKPLTEQVVRVLGTFISIPQATGDQSPKVQLMEALIHSFQETQRLDPSVLNQYQLNLTISRVPVVGLHVFKTITKHFKPAEQLQSISPNEMFEIRPTPYITISKIISDFFRCLSVVLYLKHPLVVPFNYWSSVPTSPDGYPILIMSMDNPQTNLNSSLNLSPTDKTCILYGIATVLAFFHRHGIAHRKVEAENIYLKQNDNKWRPLLGGLVDAKRKVDPLHRSSATQFHGSAFDGTDEQRDVHDFGELCKTFYGSNVKKQRLKFLGLFKKASTCPSMAQVVRWLRESGDYHVPDIESKEIEAYIEEVRAMDIPSDLDAPIWENMAVQTSSSVLTSVLNNCSNALEEVDCAICFLTGTQGLFKQGKLSNDPEEPNNPIAEVEFPVEESTSMLWQP